MITNDVSTLKINKMTQEQYDRELAAGNIKEDELYITPSVISEFEDMVTNELENLSDKTSQICNENLVPNILVLSDDVNQKISSATTKIVSSNIFPNGEVSWKLKLNGTYNWYVFTGDIGEGTDDENFGGVCRRYIGYEKPSSVGGKCYGLYCSVKANDGMIFPAGEYTLSYWLCMEGGSSSNCPHILTQSPSSALGGNIGGVTIGKWKKTKKTFTISEDTTVLYIVLDSISPTQSTSRKLRFADIKLEYGNVATRFSFDSSMDLMRNKIVELNTEKESMLQRISALEAAVAATLEEAEV